MRLAIALGPVPPALPLLLRFLLCRLCARPHISVPRPPAALRQRTPCTSSTVSTRCSDCTARTASGTKTSKRGAAGRLPVCLAAGGRLTLTRPRVHRGRSCPRVPSTPFSLPPPFFVSHLSRFSLGRANDDVHNLSEQNNSLKVRRSRAHHIAAARRSPGHPCSLAFGPRFGSRARSSSRRRAASARRWKSCGGATA